MFQSGPQNQPSNGRPTQNQGQQNQRRRQIFLLAVFALGVLILGQAGVLDTDGFLGGMGGSEARDTRYQQYRDSDDLGRLFVGARYDLADVRGGGEVPRVFVDRLPPDWESLPAVERQRFFLMVVLPLVLSVNSQMEAVRARLETAADAPDPGALGEAELALVRDVAAAFPGLSLPSDPVAAARALAERIGPLPVALTLAQAARDSDWGDAAATRSTNRLFAPPPWSELPAAALPASGPLASPYGRARLAVPEGGYASLRDAVSARALALARAPEAAGFRSRRAALEADHAPLRGEELAIAMGEGPEAAAALEALVAERNLSVFDTARLERRPTLVLVARPGPDDNRERPDG